jgi:hypothetical protein
VTSSALCGPALLALFVLAQAGDGILTYYGVATFGLQAEANPIVSWYVSAFGPGRALFAIKLVASACAVALYARAMYRTIATLTAFYVVAAVVPWLTLFYSSLADNPR